MSIPLGVIAYQTNSTTPSTQPKALKADEQPPNLHQPPDLNKAATGEGSNKSRSRFLPKLLKGKRDKDKSCDSPTLPDSALPLTGPDSAKHDSAQSEPKAKDDQTTIADCAVTGSFPQSPYTPQSSRTFNTLSLVLPDFPRDIEGQPQITPSRLPRHVEIKIPPWEQSFTNRALSRAEETSAISAANPFDDNAEMSSRTSTLDSTTSAPSPNQLYIRKGSNAQLSYNSSQSSLARQSDYESASEQESSRGGHTSATPQQGRSAGVSPAILQGNNASSNTSNLSGLVCNVHRTTGKEPHALVGATTTILGDKLYVFGGRRISRSRPTLTSDLYELDLLRRHWTKLDTKGDIPPPRYFHSVCALGDNKLVCYGGMSPEVSSDKADQGQGEQESQVSVMSDVHIYDAPTRTWMKVSTIDAPQGRYAHCAAILPSSAVFASANAPVSAIQHNPAGINPNQGSLGVQIDGTGGAEMVVVGGQDSANHYIEQISVFNLRSLTWTSTNPMSGRSCGAYRSVVTPLTSLCAAKIGAGPERGDDEYDDGEEEADDDAAMSGSPMLIYTNYNFLDVKLELQVRLPDGTLADKPMQGSVSPPGLRFPSGGVIDNNFVVAGTFLTSSKQEFSLWALDLRTLTWARIDSGSSIFSQGSWNRGVLWNRRNSFVILGNRKRNLVDDYNNRRLNFSNMCIVQLEAFGLYDNPRKASPSSDYMSISAPLVPPSRDTDLPTGGRQLSAAAESLGELALASREMSDMDFLAIDGSRIPVSSRLVARRWGPSFNALLREGASTLEGTDTATLRPTTSQLSRNSTVTITPSVNSNATTLTANSAASVEPADARALPPNSRPRTLYLPHTVQTLQALVHFLYTSSLPTPTSPLATPQVFCSLLQIARPYKIDGLLEAVVEHLHDTLDGRNAAAIFNAVAMGAGGGSGVAFASSGSNVHPPRTASLAGIEGLNLSSIVAAGERRGTLRIDTDIANGLANGRTTRNTLRPDSESGNDEDEDDIPDSASTTASLSSQLSFGNAQRIRREDREVWDGGWSAVIGLQKRGLRGLMEGRRIRERGRSEGGQVSGEAARVGLGIA
ncbi:hypothetical protein MBLNU459_g8463t1 [Dothideomycetes sp. NU459]